MANYKFVSAKEVLARVIRGTGYKLPSTYQDDVLEWIGEGMGYIQVTNSLIITSSGAPGEPNELLVNNHCVPLPCGFISVLAIEDENGNRLPLGGDITDIKTQTSSRHNGSTNSLDSARISVFEVNPYNHYTSGGFPTSQPGTSVPLYGQDLAQISNVDSSFKYYNIQGNYIQTSFESGFIRLHYLTLPVDNEGYPLIPDNENFKQALEWHIIRRLIGSGYQHPVFSWDKADEQFEKYAARAINEVSYYSLDGAMKANRSFARLIQPYRFADDFFVGSEQPEVLRK